MHAHDLQPDSVRDSGFPTVEQLRRGIILDRITQSFWLVNHELVSESVWDGNTYSETNGEGEHWAASFVKRGAVAVFFSSESFRNPFPEGRPPYDQSWYFRGMPHHLEPARERALSEMHDLNFRCRNPTGAIITAAMWSDGERFTAVEPWAEVYYHTSWVCRTHLLPPEEALRWWWKGTGFADSHMRAAWSLFERRLASTADVIPVEPWEWRAFVEIADGAADKVENAEEFLASVGITLEPYIDAPDTEPDDVAEGGT